MKNLTKKDYIGDDIKVGLFGLWPCFQCCCLLLLVHHRELEWIWIKVRFQSLRIPQHERGPSRDSKLAQINFWDVNTFHVSCCCEWVMCRCLVRKEALMYDHRSSNFGTLIHGISDLYRVPFYATVDFGLECDFFIQILSCMVWYGAFSLDASWESQSFKLMG